MAFPSQNQTMATSVKDEIRKTIETMLLALDVPYCANPYDEALHNLSVERAIARGYPMGTDPSVPSIRPFIPIGVSIAANSCAHLETETRVFMALYTALVTFVDDMYADDSAGIRGFVERFSRGEKQANVVLDALVDILKEVPNHYEPVAASIIVMAALNLTNALALEYETRGMKISPHAEGYPMYARQMAGSSATYAVMAFPRHIPLHSYIQCLPEAVIYIDYANDVLSFYKEEIAGETVNYISNSAKGRGIPKMTAFQELVDDVVRADTRVCKILEADKEAHDAWQSFKAGYVWFHTSFDRYRLTELMQ